MVKNQEMTAVLVILAVFVAVLLIGSASAMFMSGGMMGGGMMGGGGGGFSIGWLAVILILGIVLVAVIYFLVHSRRDTPTYVPPQAAVTPSPIYQFTPAIPVATTAEDQRVSSNQEAAMFNMLAEDEKRLYALIRERGGDMLQKDIVASGSFSKAKVTRLLDRLESKEIVTRERHGMTNRIRLRTMP